MFQCNAGLVLRLVRWASVKRGTGEAVSDHVSGAQEVAESSRSRG